MAGGNTGGRHGPAAGVLEAIAAEYGSVESVHDLGVGPGFLKGIDQPALPLIAHAPFLQVSKQHVTKFRHLPGVGSGTGTEVGLKILAMTDNPLAFEVQQDRAFANGEHGRIHEHLGRLGGGRSKAKEQRQTDCPDQTCRPADDNPFFHSDSVFRGLRCPRKKGAVD